MAIELEGVKHAWSCLEQLSKGWNPLTGKLLPGKYIGNNYLQESIEAKIKFRRATGDWLV